MPREETTAVQARMARTAEAAQGPVHEAREARRVHKKKKTKTETTTTRAAREACKVHKQLVARLRRERKKILTRLRNADKSLQNRWDTAHKQTLAAASRLMYGADRCARVAAGRKLFMYYGNTWRYSVLTIAGARECPPDIQAALYSIVEQADRTMRFSVTDRFHMLQWDADPIHAFRVFKADIHSIATPTEDAGGLLAWFTAREGDGLNPPTEPAAQAPAEFVEAVPAAAAVVQAPAEPAVAWAPLPQ
jgi:hypothetical protein